MSYVNGSRARLYNLVLEGGRSHGVVVCKGCAVKRRKKQRAPNAQSGGKR